MTTPPDRPRLPFLTRARARAAGLARLAAYVAVVGGVLGAVGVRAAKAEAGKAGLALGRQLLPLVELETERSTIRINGQSLYVSSAVVDGTPASTLDRVEHDCARGSYAPPFDVFRREDPTGNEGVVFCFVHAPERTATAALADFRATRDLGAFGTLRYAFVKRAEEGRVRVVSTWTDGSFRIDARLPNGDAAGSDPEAAPRPPRATRLLSATLGEAPYGMYAFGSPDAPGDVMRFYDDTLAKAKWVVITAPPEKNQDTSAPPVGRTYVKDGVQILVTASRDARADRTLVSVGELGVGAHTVKGTQR